MTAGRRGHRQVLAEAFKATAVATFAGLAENQKHKFMYSFE
jgi:hypothetical protein